MDRRTLTFVALALSMLYGAGFAVVDDPGAGYAQIGGVLVALGWIAVGMFGRESAN